MVCSFLPMAYSMCGMGMPHLSVRVACRVTRLSGLGSTSPKPAMNAIHGPSWLAFWRMSAPTAPGVIAPCFHPARLIPP